MKRVKLDKPTIEPLLILGLISSENDIKLAWIINNLLRIHFSRLENDAITQKIGNPEYSIFQFTSNNLLYTLIANKLQFSRLFEELKKFDYIFVVSGESDDIALDAIKTSLKKEAAITALFEVAYQDIKKKDLFEFF